MCLFRVILSGHIISPIVAYAHINWVKPEGFQGVFAMGGGRGFDFRGSSLCVGV